MNGIVQALTGIVRRSSPERKHLAERAAALAKRLGPCHTATGMAQAKHKAVGPRKPPKRTEAVAAPQRNRTAPGSAGDSASRGRGFVRIIAGKYRGYRLPVAESPGLRPTADRVREAWFSALMSRHLLAEATVVDLFAGTGALGFEALSRGAKHVLFVDHQRPLLEAIRAHAVQLGCSDQVSTLAVDLLQEGGPWVKVAALLPEVSLVLSDPPYAIAEALGPMLQAFPNSPAAAPSAHLMLELPVPTTLVLDAPWELLKRYPFRGRELWLAACESTRE